MTVEMWHDRVRAEKDELDVKSAELVKLIGGKPFFALPDRQRHALNAQLRSCARISTYCRSRLEPWE